jgi:hypothetical protein
MKFEVRYKSKDTNVLNDVIYRDAIILSPGVWNQKDKKSQIYYPEDICIRDAKNWKRDFIYVEHTKRKDGTPENAFNIIGMVENQRFDYLRKAIVADLRIMPITQAGMDAVNLIDRGVIKFLSPEVRTWDKHNYYTKRREVYKLEFNGVSLVVDNPACKDAKIDRFKKSVVNV